MMEKRNVPEFATPLEKGMFVKDAEGLRLGHVKGLPLDSARHAVTHILLQRPTPRTVTTPATMEQSMSPIDPVENVCEGEVRLRITRRHLCGLAVCEPPGKRKQRIGEA